MLFLDHFNEYIYPDFPNNDREIIYQTKEILERSGFAKQFSNEVNDVNDDLINALKKLSGVLNKCRIKSLLLPKMNTKSDVMEQTDCFYNFMISEDTLKNIAAIFSGNSSESCLILQPKESPGSLEIFDAFPNFDVALRQADLWPAVMLWDKRGEFVFVPIQTEEELYGLYEIISVERHPIDLIRSNMVNVRRKTPNEIMDNLSGLLRRIAPCNDEVEGFVDSINDVISSEAKQSSVVALQEIPKEIMDNLSELLRRIAPRNDEVEGFMDSTNDIISSEAEQSSVRALQKIPNEIMDNLSELLRRISPRNDEVEGFMDSINDIISSETKQSSVGALQEIPNEIMDNLSELLRRIALRNDEVEWFMDSINDVISNEAKQSSVVALQEIPNYFIFQLSDLHFGARNVGVAVERLKSLIENQISSFEKDDVFDFIITGDAIDSPDPEAKKDYRKFSDFLKKRFGRKPILILGNHDIRPGGVVTLPGIQENVNATGEYPKKIVLEEHNVILLLFNSNTDGYLAEGKIGTTQMAEMGNLLDRVKDLHKYLLVAVMHHHLLPIPRPDFYCKEWYEKIPERLGFFSERLGIFSERLLEKSQSLIDADLFLEWLKQRKVKLVLHGHKHIPFIVEKDGINVISCGSSTGQMIHKDEGKTYISYNIIKISKKAVTCSQFAEDILGGGAKSIKTEIMPL